MASVVKAMGWGGALCAERELGWDRTTTRKGLGELRTGSICVDAAGRGRKPAEARLPNLQADLRAIGEAASQTDPTFRTTPLYRRLTAGEARRALIEEKGYRPEEAPSERSLRRKLSAMGFQPRRVAKSRFDKLKALSLPKGKPLRKVPQTDAIFQTVHQINRDAEADEGTVRLSIDTKTVAPIGNLSRGGKSRQGEVALDHDLEPEAKVTPFGIHRPETAERWFCFTTGSVRADFMAGRLSEIWPTLKKNDHRPHTLVINADNGPEKSGVRTQWIKRLVELSAN